MAIWLDDLGRATAFLTRLPVPARYHAGGSEATRALRMFPLVGGAIGLMAGLAFAGLLAVGAPPLLAAILALALQAGLTGALHEDGLADCADGFGGGRDRAAKLAIMRDSRVGSYGALALVLSVGIRAAALSALAPWDGLAALVAAGALGRAALPILLAALPPARSDGLAASLPAPDPPIWFAGGLAALLVVLIALDSGGAIAAILAALAAGLAMRRLALRQIGGQTGDVLGATEQAIEIAILSVLACRP